MRRSLSISQQESRKLNLTSVANADRRRKVISYNIVFTGANECYFEKGTMMAPSVPAPAGVPSFVSWLSVSTTVALVYKGGNIAHYSIKKKPYKPARLKPFGRECDARPTRPSGVGNDN
ncbi:hypothetical protein [Segetibacter sp. 3557_3]|uniref:hypothetical protein n=1 Tax=Segetibacter sp. 3557_3 TaxID=2547429 RepID=UPI001405122F|nr:hypothetical protein [Segetibacter sp. 3557_3]